MYGIKQKVLLDKWEPWQWM